MGGNVQIDDGSGPVDPGSGAFPSASIRTIAVTGDASANIVNLGGVTAGDFTGLVSTLVDGGGGGDTINVTGHSPAMTAVKFSDGSAAVTFHLPAPGCRSNDPAAVST